MSRSLSVIISILTILLILIVIALIFFFAKEYYIDMEKKDFDKALSKFEIGIYNEALSLFSDFIAKYPQSEKIPQAYYYIAYCLYKQKEYERAKEIIEKLLNKIDYEKDSELMVKAIVLSGEIASKLNEIYNPYLEKQLELALVKAKDEAMKNNIMTQLGYINYYKGDYKKALEYFDYANTELALMGKARVYQKLGEREKVIAIYEDLIQKYPGSKYYKAIKNLLIEVLYQTARNYFLQNQFQLAEYYYKRTLKYALGTIYEDASLYWLGEIAYRMKNYDVAVEYFKKILVNQPVNKDPDATFMLALIYRKTGKLEKSAEYLKRFLDLYPNHRLSTKAKELLKIVKQELMLYGQEEPQYSPNKKTKEKVELDDIEVLITPEKEKIEEKSTPPLLEEIERMEVVPENL